MNAANNNYEGQELIVVMCDDNRLLVFAIKILNGYTDAVYDLIWHFVHNYTIIFKYQDNILSMLNQKQHQMAILIKSRLHAC